MLGMRSTALLAGLLLTATSLASATGAPCGELPPDWRANLLLALNRLRAEGASCNAGMPNPGAAQTQPMDRAVLGAPALTWHDTLDLIAQQQAIWIAWSGQAQHLGPAGESPAQRALAAGYEFAAVAENVALGLPTVDAAVQAWRGSAAHCKNLADRRLLDAGVACRVSAAGPAWVLTLAAPRAPAGSTPAPTPTLTR